MTYREQRNPLSAEGEPSEKNPKRAGAI